MPKENFLPLLLYKYKELVHRCHQTVAEEAVIKGAPIKAQMVGNKMWKT